MENEIIEAEIVDEKLDEVDTKKRKPKKTRDDHSKSISFWGNVAAFCFRFGSGFLIFFVLAGFVFSILSSQSNGTDVFRFFMILFWCLAGVSLLLSVAGYLARFFMRSLKKKDPNFEADVASDDVY